MEHKKINYCFRILSAIFSIIFFSVIYRFCINIPMDDDFPALQNFLVRFIQSDGLAQKIVLFIEAGNMHRLVWMRLNVLLVYALCGELNYSAYIFLTCLFFIGIGLIFYRLVRKSNMKGMLTLVMVLLLLNGQNMGNAIWAMSGIANIGSVFITFLSIYCLLSERRAVFFGGLAVSLITIYSNGNGMLIIPPVLICLYLQKRIKDLIVFGLISVSAALLYFHGLESSRMESSILDNIPVFVMNIFIFAGCNLWIPSVIYISLFAGIACAAVYIWGIFNKAYKKNLFVYACLTFLFLTAIAVSAGNPPVIGGESTTPWRYRIYGSLFLILTSFLLIENARAFHVKKIIYLFPALALLFSIFSTVYCYRKVERRYEHKIVSAYHWNREGKRLGLRYPKEEEALIFYLKEAERLNLYSMPEYPLSKYKNSITPYRKENLKSASEKISFGLDVEEEDNFFVIDGWAYLTEASKSMESEDIYIYLVNSSGRWACRPNFERRFDIIDDTSKADCGFLAVIDKKEIPPGTYKLEIGIKSRLNPKRPVYVVSTDWAVVI